MNRSLALDLKKLKTEIEARPARFFPLNLFRLRVVNLIQAYTLELGVAVKQVKFRPMKTRWGSCGSHGVICINTKLKQLPDELIELVVFHECLHLLYLNHGVEFKSKLRAKFTDYAERNKQLKLYGLVLS